MNKLIKFVLILIILKLFLLINKVLKNNNLIIKKSINIQNYIPKQKYKIALCLSGRIEKIKKCYYSWKKYLINFYDIDIFMHVSIPNESEKLFIKNIIKPKKIIYYDIPKTKQNLKNLLFLQIYRIYNCNNLKNEFMKSKKFKYNLVIKSRPDIIFNQKLNLDFVNKEYLYVPLNNKTYNSTNIFDLGITDQIFISNNSIIDTCCNYFKNINKYKNISCMIPEISFKKYLMDNNINFKFFKFNWNIIYYTNYPMNGHLNYKYLSKVPLILNSTCFINLK